MKQTISRLSLVLALAGVPFVGGCAAVSAVKCTFKPARQVTTCVDEEFGTSFSKTGPTAPAKLKKGKE